MKKADLASDSVKKECFYEHGQMNITRCDARKILGTPHYVETDDFRTAGGEEDHWVFQYDDGIYVFFNLRVPYHALSLNFSVRDLLDLRRRLPNALKNFELAVHAHSYRLF